MSPRTARQTIHEAVDIAMEAALSASCHCDKDMEVATRDVRDAVALLRTRTGFALLKGGRFQRERADIVLPRAVLLALASRRDEYAWSLATLAKLLSPALGGVLRAVVLRARRDVWPDPSEPAEQLELGPGPPL